MRQLIYALAPIAVIASPACAQALPNETDLKAAFCQGVLNSVQPGLQSTKPSLTPEIARLVADSAEKLVAAQQRLYSYLFPRAQFVDKTSLTFAMAEGGRAWHQAAKRFTECQSDPASLAALSARDAKALTAAMEKCNGAARDRIKPCFDPSFLPF